MLAEWLKGVARRASPIVQERRWFRRLMTRNGTSGKLAIGEQNRYGIRCDWITVDHDGADIRMDFRRHTPLPFGEGSQSLIYSAHTIEHIDEATLIHVLGECFRVLRPGGGIRLEAPDLEKMVEAYRRRDRAVLEPLAEENDASLVEALGLPEVYGEDHVALLGLASSYRDERNAHIPVLASREEVDAKAAALTVEEFGRWCVSLQTPQQQQSGGHVTPIYFEKLRRLLEAIGFRDIMRRENGQTRLPGLTLRNLERPHRAAYSLYVEARK